MSLNTFNKSKSRRSTNETKDVLSIFKEKNIISALDGKRYSNNFKLYLTLKRLL